MKDWKTSAAGFLSAFLVTIGPITAYLAATGNPKSAAIGAGLVCAGAIARAWLGLIQNDAPAN